MKIKQLFFDCDNTLVDTEVSAVEVCAGVVNKVLEDHDISQRYMVEELIGAYFGKTARQMIVELGNVHGYKLSDEQKAKYALYEEDLVIQHILGNPEPCHGIQGVLETLTTQYEFQLAVVSSSPIRRIRAALEAGGIAKYFKPEHVYSAKNSMPMPKSKPDPAIYQWAMAQNNVKPDQCIAFEDSRSGARSAIDAGIATIAYVGAYRVESHRDDVARILMDEGCKLVMGEWRQFDACFGQVMIQMGDKFAGFDEETISRQSLSDFTSGKAFDLKPPPVGGTKENEKS